MKNNTPSRHNLKRMFRLWIWELKNWLGLDVGISRKDAKRMVGPGWSKILDKLYDQKPRNVHVLQVKEKYGGLRFYVGGAPESFFDAIDEAERESYKICEQCGEPGKLREDLGWILTLCDEHYQETIKDRKRGRTIIMQDISDGWMGFLAKEEEEQHDGSTATELPKD